MSTFAFEVSHLRKNYGPRAALDIDALRVEQGRITALMGPNGSGKTTLLECLNGLIRPDSGDIQFFGAPLTRAARRRMTMVFQSPRLFRGTVAYNVAYGPHLRGRRDAKIISNALDAVRLPGFENRPALRLSGGESRRVAIARALAVEPDVLLLDEPTANIDAENTAVIEDVIQSLCEQHGMTILLSTHSQEQAARLSHCMLSLDRGRVAPWVPENRFTAEIAIRDGKKYLIKGNNITGDIASDLPPGPVDCSIRVDDISVSGAQGAARGFVCWAGIVTVIARERRGVRMTLDAGVPLTVRLSDDACQDLRPSLGDTLYLSFKSSSLQIQQPDHSRDSSSK